MISITPNDKRWYSLQDLPDEKWLNVDGYTCYFISNYGRLKSLARHTTNTRILVPRIGRDGYTYNNLQENGEHRKTLKTHRMVATAFIPNPDNLPEVNHIDAVKTNNYVTNLEWCTSSYNHKHAYKMGCCKHWMLGRKGKDCPFSKKINQYTKDDVYVRTWDSMNDITRSLGIPTSDISMCCNGKKKSYGGFLWRFYKEGDEYDTHPM